MRVFEKGRGIDAEESVGDTATFCVGLAGSELFRPCRAERVETGIQALLDGRAQQCSDRGAVESLRDIRDEGLCLRTRDHEHQARICAELPCAHQAACRELFGQLVAALVQSAGQHVHRVDARQLQVNRFADCISRLLQHQPRSVANHA